MIVIKDKKDMETAPDTFLKNIPYKLMGKYDGLNFVDKEKNMIFKSASEIAALLAPLDITKDKEITTYCQGGIRAAHVFFVLELLGYKNLHVYDGSFREWGNRQDTPIQ